MVWGAGQDVHKEEKGTWFGVSKHGKLAVLTNFRTPLHEIKADAKTRGEWRAGVMALS